MRFSFYFFLIRATREVFFYLIYVCFNFIFVKKANNRFQNIVVAHVSDLVTTTRVNGGASKQRCFESLSSVQRTKVPRHSGLNDRNLSDQTGTRAKKVIRKLEKLLKGTSGTRIQDR